MQKPFLFSLAVFMEITMTFSKNSIKVSGNVYLLVCLYFVAYNIVGNARVQKVRAKSEESMP